jgi:hypothetical protein
MPDPITALVVGGTQVVGGIMQSQAAGEAAGAQTAAAEAGIAEQRRQFDLVQQLLKPYVEAGTPALQQQQALIGLQGPQAQQQAISALEQGAGFQAQVRAGEEALLQRASATGGLRGGNIQAALAQFRPQMLQREIETQYGRLGGLTSLGQQSAAGVGTAGMQTGARVAGLYGDVGAAQAGKELAQGQAFANVLNLPAQFLGMQYGAKVGTPGFGNIFSDRRLKRNIVKIGTRPDGLGVYEFEYIWGGGRQIGLMAQEVQGVYPDAVGEAGGYLTVNYSKV